MENAASRAAVQYSMGKEVGSLGSKCGPDVETEFIKAKKGFFLKKRGSLGKLAFHFTDVVRGLQR